MGVPVHIAGAPAVALRETCRVVAGQVPLWAYHRARLSAGGCAGAVLDAVEEAALAAAAEWGGAESPRVRLSLTVAPDGSIGIDASRRLSSLDVPGSPVAVRVDVPVRPGLPQGGAKPADRGWWDAAQRRAKALGGHQAVLVDPHGVIVDGGTATVWIAEGPRLFTPTSPAAIAGVARAFLLRAAGVPHIEVTVEDVTWERFAEADEAFLTNAFGGAAPIRGRHGEVYGAVSALFDEMWHSV